MISSEVQRTLVKSPPELWAELSDPAALARHLGELGEIRIVRTEPERVVEWAAENTTGTVSLKASGWGTKVTLSVTRELSGTTPTDGAETPAMEELDADAPDELDANATAEATPDLAEPQDVAEPQTAAEPAPTRGVEPIDEPRPVTVTHAPQPEPTAFEIERPEAEAASLPEIEREPEPRRGFFARLFGRRRREESSELAMQAVAVPSVGAPAVEESATAMLDVPTTPDAPDAFAAVRQVLEPETFAAEHPFAAVPEIKQPAPDPVAADPAPDADEQQNGDLAAELLAAEEASAEEVTAVLTAVLDRLGAAHHRPFSRS
jgi:hypothetical protein